MFERILVCGAGAIGGTAGAFLKRAGHPITMVDANRAHVEAIRTRGFTITGPIAEFSVVCEAYTPEELKGGFDLVLFAVKSYHTQAAIEMVKPHLAPRGVLVSMQNGLNEFLIKDVIGAERTMGAFVHYGVDYIKPGHIAYATHGPFVLGEIDGRISERLKAVHGLIRQFEPDAAMTDNIFGYLWTKLAFGPINFLQALSNEPTQDFLDDPKYRPMLCRVVTEIAKVAQAEGVRLMSIQGFEPGKFLDGNIADMNASISAYADARRGSKKTHTGVWQDIVLHKRPSETVYQYGPLFAAAKKHGIAVPALRASVDLIEAAETGSRPLSNEMAMEVVSLVHSLAGGPAHQERR